MLLYKKPKNILVMLFSALLLSGCANHTVLPGFKPASLMDGSMRRTVDWRGTYFGMLPCEDCIGIRTTLKLYANDTYTEKVSSVFRPDMEYSSEGRFVWNWLGNEITLSNGRKYRIGRDLVILLDDNGKQPKGTMSDYYILRREGYESPDDAEMMPK